MSLKLLPKNNFTVPALYLLLAVPSIVMILTITQYGGMDEDVGFLKYKQDYLPNKVWKAAFYIHVFSCVFCLLAGFTQFSQEILQKARKLHRLMGRFYAYNILLINFPAGMLLAVYANGLLPSKIAFVILDMLWFSFTAMGVLSIRKGNLQSHREFMIRSYALTLSALTLRLWKAVLTTFTTLDYPTIYMIDAWLGFVPNLLVAEWIIRMRRKRLPGDMDVVCD